MILDSKLLRSALAELAPICGKRSPIPLAAFVRLKTIDGAFQLLCANGEAQAESWIECEGTLNDMPCVNHRTFAAMLPSSGKVELTEVAGVLQIKSGDSIKELPSTDWSAMPLFNLEAPSKRIPIDTALLASAIQTCAFASASNAGFQLSGLLHIKSEEDKTVVEAADGRIVAIVSLPRCADPIDLTLPYELATLLCPVLSAENATLGMVGNMLVAGVTGKQVIVKTSESKYIDTRVIRAKPQKKVGTVSASELLACFESVMAVYEEGVACSVEIGRDDLVVKYRTKFGSVEAPLVGAFKPQEVIHINPTVAIPPLKVLEGDVDLALLDGGDKNNGLVATQDGIMAMMMLCRGN